MSIPIQQVLDTITTLHRDFVAEDSPRVVFERLLESLLRITGSEYGFIGELLHTPEGAPYLKTYAITNIAWNQETRDFYQANAPTGLEFYNLESLFGHSLTTGEVVVTNDPSTHPKSCGIPAGHPPLNAYVGLPLTHGGEMKGLAGFANRPGGYDESLVEDLQPLSTTCGGIIHSYNVSRERDRAEARLRESESRLRLVADSLPILTAMVDADLNFAFVNERFAQALQLRVDQITGKPARELLGENVFEVLMPLVQAVLRGVRRDFEYGSDFPGLDRRVLRSSMVPARDTAGNVNGFYWMSQDITDDRQVEEQLRTARRAAETANQAKSDFLANMSHEIRTPMTAILGYTDFLADSLQNPENQEQIARIRSNGEHLLEVINDILDLSRIESGKMSLESILFSPRQLIEQVRDLMLVRAEGKGLMLEASIDDEVPEILISDPTRLRQILINLVGNSIKFTDSGAVSIRCRFRGDDELQIDVTDTGVGIPLASQPCLFDAFAQADSSTSRRFGGTGLGLTISRRLGQLLGGDVSLVESIPDSGSRFRVEVRAPRAQCETLAASASAPGAPPAEARLDDVRILLADDAPDNRLIVARYLSKVGAQVETVENGVEARDRVLAEWQGERPFDLVLMDMQMPVMDGYEATRHIRDEGYEGLIVSLTAHAMAEDRQRCLAAGCDEHATKPIDREKFIPTLRSLLDRKS